MQPLSGNHRPDLLTALMKMSLVLRLPRKMHLCIFSSNVPRLPAFWEMPQNPQVLLTFDKVHNPLRVPRESTSEPPKVARTCCVLCILTLKCASRHNSAHFFDIATSKSGRDLVCFVHFDFEMCFAPQRRALFHLRRFSEPTFRPSGATNHWKNTVLCDFPTFSRTCIFFLLTLSLLWFFSLFYSSLFYCSLLSDSSHLCFSSVHIVGSLTSKLPLIIQYYSHLRPQTYHRPDMNSSIPGLHCKGKWTRISKKLHQCVLIDQGATHHVAVLCVCSQSFHCLRWSMGWHRILLGDRALKGQKVNKSSWHGVLKIHNVCLLMPEFWRNTWFTSVQYSFVGRDIWPILGVCHESIGTLLSMMLSGAQIIDSANL